MLEENSILPNEGSLNYHPGKIDVFLQKGKRKNWVSGQTWKYPRGDSETGDFVIPFLRHDVKEGVVVNHELQKVIGVISVNLIQSG